MSHEWLYYVIHPGGDTRMDLAITQIVAPAVAESRTVAGIDRWFFIRYLDERGLHVRLRFRGTSDAVTSLQERLDPLIADRLAQVSSTQPRLLKRLFTVNLLPAPSDHIGFDYAIYEPEYEKYGGEVGVDIAERLFQDSSELALDTLGAEAADMQGRATLAVMLMVGAAESFVAPDKRKAFWDDYGTYWAGGNADAALALKTRLAEAALRRRDVLLRYVEQFRSNETVQTRTKAYIEKIRSALDAVRAAALPIPVETLCFHYVHMMNNRLGILPIEETYLAAFAAQVEREHVWLQS